MRCTSPEAYVTKTCEDVPYVVVGDNYTYEITLNSFSINNLNISLYDYLPSFSPQFLLNQTYSLNALTSHTFSVSGNFNSSGLITNTVTATLNGNDQTASCSQLVENSCSGSANKTYVAPITYSSSFSGNVISNQTLYFKGNLTVDHQLTFVNCTIFMDPGTEINVTTSSFFKLDQTNIVACSRMWKGVKLLADESTVRIINHSKISDAEYGIFIAAYHIGLEVDESEIVNCFIPIYMPEKVPFQFNSLAGLTITNSKFGLFANALPLPYSGQTTVMGAKPKCAIELWNLNLPHDIGNLYSGTSNVFYNCNAGIVAFRCLGLSILNNSFVDIKKDATFNYSWPVALDDPNGNAISSIGDNTLLIPNIICDQHSPQLLFQNCDVGVFTKKSNAPWTQIWRSTARIFRSMFIRYGEIMSP